MLSIKAPRITHQSTLEWIFPKSCYVIGEYYVVIYISDRQTQDEEEEEEVRVVRVEGVEVNRGLFLVSRLSGRVDSAACRRLPPS